MAVIKGYKLKGELSSQNAGFCRWGYCEKGGHEYFIKEFLTPVYPINVEEISLKTVERKRKQCESFFQDKSVLYRALENCRTGNIVFPQDFFRYGSKYYLVTDKIDDSINGLDIIVGLSEEKKLVLIKSILYSISKLHNEGIVHSDIKPDNVMIKKTYEGFYTAKIIDFDASFFINNPPEEIQGDFVYFSPEAYYRTNGEDIKLDDKIDIFALGILFHQYWSGELPVVGDDYRYVFEAVSDNSTVQLSESIPIKYRTMISRMLSADASDRPSALELLNELKTPVPTMPESPPTADYLTQPPDDTESPVESKPAYIGFYVPKDFDN